MQFMFEKLIVYQKAVDFADQICAHTAGFRRGYGSLVDQSNRAALYISANIAEGNGRFTKADSRNYLGIARLNPRMCTPSRAGSPTAIADFRRSRFAQRKSGGNRPDAVGLDRRA
jgi:hypothetical protein